MADLPVWGVHITISSIRGVKLGREGGRVRVLAHDQFDFAEDIEDVNSLERHGALAHGLYVFAKRHDLSNCKVIVSVDAATAFNRYVETPLVEGESMSRLLEYEAQQQIPFDLDTVHWDHKVLHLDHEENIAHIMLFAVRREVVEERLRRLQKLRFPADGAQIAPVALYNYAAYEGLAQDGYALVSVDYHRSDIVIAHEGRFWFRSLPTGVSSYIEAIREAIEPKHRIAVRIARGEEKPADKAALKEVRDAYAERLSSELARMLEYYRGTLRDVDLKAILLVPGSRLVPPIGKYLKSALGLDVFMVGAFRELEMDSAIVTPDVEKSVASLAHAAGLALQGLGEAEVEISLHTEDLERDLGVNKLFYALTVCLAFALVGVLWWRAESHLGALDEQARQLDEQLADAESSAQSFVVNHRETDAEAVLAPFGNAGEGRLLASRAVEVVLDVVAESNAGRGSEDQNFLVKVETRPADFEGGRALDRRRIRMVLGRLDQKGVDAYEALERDVVAQLEKDPRISAIQRDGARFTAARLTESGGESSPDRLLRRRFRIAEYEFLFDARGDSAARGN